MVFFKGGTSNNIVPVNFSLLYYYSLIPLAVFIRRKKNIRPELLRNTAEFDYIDV